MELPSYMSSGDERVCLLRKALSGLKQSPRAWYEKHSSYLVKLGFTSTTSDHSVFVRDDGRSLFIIAVYVADLVLMTKSWDDLTSLKRSLMKDLGELEQCLGLLFSRDKKNRQKIVSQEHTIQKLLIECNMQDCSAKNTTVKTGLMIKRIDQVGSDAQLSKLFRQLVGSVMYEMLGSRPDICFTVNLLS